MDAWTTELTGVIKYIVFATPPASVANMPSVNVAKVNGVAVLGAGTAADKWRGE